MNTINAAPQHTGSVPEVASMVHDLRNPLTAIHGGAELLVGSSLSQPQIRRIARNMYGASLRMKELLDELLSRWASRERDSELCDLRDLIVGAVDKIAVIAESQSVRIVQNIPDRLVLALERHRMHSVVVNLLVNALEAMPTGGTIDISAVFDGYSVVVQVCDSGPGIAPEIRAQAVPAFRNCRQGKWLRPGPGAFTAGCDRSWRRNVGGVVPPRSPLFLSVACHGLAGARRVMLISRVRKYAESAEPPGTTPGVVLRAQRNRQFS